MHRETKYLSQALQTRNKFIKATDPISTTDLCEYYINFNFHTDKKFDEHADVLYFKQIFEIYTKIKKNDRQLHKVIITHKEILHTGFCPCANTAKEYLS